MQPSPPGYPPLDLTGVHVLVIDDSAESRHLLADILEGFGATVRTAESGAEGLRLAIENPPAIIFSDLMMPVMDGFEFMEHLHTEPLIASVPVFAVSALGGEEDQQRTQQAGFYKHFLKPIDLDLITDELRRMFGDVERPA